MIWKETTRLLSQPFCTMTSWYIFWKTCSTSFINKIDKDSFPSITSSMTFTTSLNEKVQIRALFKKKKKKYIYIYLFISVFGCIRSQLWRVGSFVMGCRLLSSCSTQAQLLHSMWNLSSPTRDQTCIPCIRRQILNHWTTREVLQTRVFLKHFYFCCTQQNTSLLRFPEGPKVFSASGWSPFSQLSQINPLSSAFFSILSSSLPPSTTVISLTKPPTT